LDKDKYWGHGNLNSKGSVTKSLFKVFIVAHLSDYKLKGTLTRSVSNKHMGRCLRPAVGTATTFKNFPIAPLKGYNFLKIHLNYRIRILSFASMKVLMAGHRSMEQALARPQINGTSLLQAADQQKKLVCIVHFYLPLLWVSRPEAKNWRAYCPHGSR
jgi:hypothetical protein